MYSYEYRGNLSLGRVCLEMSLKPFKRIDDKYIEDVCTEIFYQYRDLLDKADACSVLLWVAEGSDILDYSGDLQQEIEWAKYMGNPNFVKEAEFDEEEKGSALHHRSRLYTKDPAVITYNTLKKIIKSIKTIGDQMTGIKVEVGATFDPGPEFAKSDFKYNRHKEIAQGTVMGKNMWCHCAGILSGDNYKYAAFPDGIPENTQLGTFIGKQFNALAHDVGYDYIWLSNGFGYSLESWNWRGECFDGVDYKEGVAKKVYDKILGFWKSFSLECPDIRIETRGSNLSTGMDIGAHGSPIKKIYDNYNVTAPPNSPWAALDYRFSLELVGYMSRIAHLPKNGYIFRYYLHDPWWLNSPWFDRYGQQPHDIYLPLSVSRLDENGDNTPPYGMSLLTIDDSHGNLPRRGPIEITPHILNAYENMPDSPGIITWLYPFSHYDEIAINQNRASEVCFGDWFINDAIENGFPVNSVISDTNMQGLNSRIIKETIVLSIVPDANSDIENKIYEILSNGGEVMLYGPVDKASERILELIGVTITEGISGYGDIKPIYDMDNLSNGSFSYKLGHKNIISGGSINTISNGYEKVLVTSEFVKDGQSYVYSIYNNNALNGKLSWVRGSYSEYQGDGDRLPNIIDKSMYYQSGCLMRYTLKHFGINLMFEIDNPTVQLPIVLFSKHNNGLRISGFAPDSTVKTLIKLKDGVPIMKNSSVIIKDNLGEISCGNWWNDECRLFVEQKECGVITSRTRATVFPGKDRRIDVSGLKDATVTFYTYPNTNFSLSLNDDSHYAKTNVDFKIFDNGKKIKCENLTGTLSIAYGESAEDHLK